MMPMKTKILIIEHDSNDMELIQEELKKGNANFITEIVETKKEYTEALHTFKPDIILSNYTFPAFDGLTALKIREKLVPQTPFIFVSELINQENTKGLIKNGVTDFVLKKRLYTLIDKMNLALQKAELSKTKTLLRQSEEKRKEQLSLYESKYQSLVESSMDAILLTVKDGRILTANTAACEIFKMTNDEICNSRRLDIVDLTDPRLQILLKERNRTGRANGELTFKRKDGSKFPGEITSVVFTDAFGQDKTSMTIRDLSVRKKTEQKLAQSTDDLQQAINDRNNILNSSLDVICSFDKEGRFVGVSDAAKHIWGYKPEELKGMKFIDLVFYEDAQSTLEEDIKIKSGLPVTMFENRYIHKNGSIVPMLWSSRWDERNQLSYAVTKNATDKKNLEKAFEIERQRFMDLYSHAPSCMGILKGPNHIYEVANPLYLQLIGKKDIIGKTVKEVLPELEAQGIFEFLDTVYKTGITFSANEMLVKFDFYGNGKLVETYLNFIYQAHRNPDGDIDGILFFAINVTEQVLSRKKIEQSVLRYTSLIEQARDAICFVDSSMKIIEVNRYACEKLGYSKAEFLELSVTDFFLDEDLKANPLKIDTLKTGKTIRGERRIKRKDNSLIDVELSAKILTDGNMLLFVRDISEHKKAQLALIESEKKYRQIVETAQEGIWLIDETNITTFVNSKMSEILEYTREEIIDKEIYSFMDEKGKQIVDGILLRKEEKCSLQGHFKFISKKGKKIWVRISANPIFDEAGIYKGSLAMITDITKSKKAEEKLEKQNLQLIKTNSELDRFVYSVSHDLRSPLTSVLGLLSLIEGESQEPDTLKHAEMIRKSINRLDEFIKNILSYSRNNRIKLEIEKIPVQQTIIDSIESLQSRKDAEGIIFDIAINEQEPFYTDSLRFYTVMENLISNAIKHHKKDVPERYVKITGYSDKEMLKLTVADNGIGIAPENHQKIFDMFFRLSSKTDGSGIGLYIVKDTIEKLNGSIVVESELDNGTNFTITLKNLNNERMHTSTI